MKNLVMKIAKGHTCIINCHVDKPSKGTIRCGKMQSQKLRDSKTVLCRRMINV